MLYNDILLLKDTHMGYFLGTVGVIGFLMWLTSGYDSDGNHRDEDAPYRYTDDDGSDDYGD